MEKRLLAPAIQVGIARDLMDLSDACVVSNLAIEKAIHAHDAARRVHLLPVMSNFGEPGPESIDARSSKRWVICGGTALITRSLKQLDRLLPLIPEHFAPEHLDVVGGRADRALSASLNSLKQNRKLAVHHYPEVSAELASEVLRRSRFGWIDYFGAGPVWPGMILKSGAFAALCAHCVIPILSHREEPVVVEGDALPGPYYLTSDGLSFPSTGENTAAIGQRFYHWYHAHADSQRAANVYANALT